MAKPIFLVGLPQREGELESEEIEHIQRQCDHRLNDYHTVIYLHTKNEVEFRVVYEKDFDEVKFEGLKEIVRGSMIPSQQ